MNKYLKTLDEEVEEEDLVELEELSLPKKLQLLSQQRETSSIHGWQPINKTKASQYTTGIMTQSGWQLIDNPATTNTPSEGISTAHALAPQQGDIPDEVGLVIEPPSDPVDGEENEENLDDVNNFPWLDDSYFDHYGYLNFMNDVKDSKDNDELDLAPESKRSVIQSKSRVADKKGVRLGFDNPPPKSAVRKGPLLSPRQTTKIPADIPVMEDTTINDANQPVHGTLEFDNEGNHNASPETSSDEAGKWELLEGNTDAPRTSNVSVHKLTIQLHNTATGESKTLAYTQAKDINWTSRPQVTAITQWRTDVFHEHGLNTKKNVIVYTPLEDAWMTLFHRKLRATIEAGHLVKIPGPASVLVAFNAYFEGRALRDANGEDVGPRPSRDAISIRGKLDGRASKIAKERKEMRELLEGKKSGAVFVPAVTEAELTEFQENGTVAVDDPSEASKNASSSGEGRKSKRSLPKRKREKEDAGERETKKAKQTTADAKKLSET
jgi:hypothetical protein